MWDHDARIRIALTTPMLDEIFSDSLDHVRPFLNPFSHPDP